MKKLRLATTAVYHPAATDPCLLAILIASNYLAGWGHCIRRRLKGTGC